MNTNRMLNRYETGLMNLVCWFLTAIVLTGCAPLLSQHDGDLARPAVEAANGQQRRYSRVLDASLAAADFLARSMGPNAPKITGPILTASLVDIDNFDRSSTFGRLVPEQIAARLAQHGFEVKEIKLRNASLFIKAQQGEFLLSRRLKDISTANDAGSVLVGTYTENGGSVMVSIRLVRTQDNVILTGYSYEVRLGARQYVLLKN